MDYADLLIIFWTIISIYILRQIRFFDAAPLLRAPERRGAMGLLMFGGVILFYISLLVIAVTIVRYLPAGPVMFSEKGRADLAAATQPLTQPVTSTDFFPILMTMIAQNVVGIVTAFVIAFVAHAMIRGGVRAFGFDRRKIIRGVLVGLFALFLMWPWMTLLQTLVIHLGAQIRGGPPPIHPVLEMLKEGPPATVKYALVATAVFFAPVFEETLFRGLLQTSLLKYFRRDAVGRWSAIAIASVVFTSIHYQSGPHGVNWEHFPPLFLLSCVLGYIYERTGNLWSNITLHALFNAIVTAQTLLMIDAK